MVDPKRLAKGLWWDRAWHLISGCTPASEACHNCWAAREAHMRSKHPRPAVRARYEGLTTRAGNWNGKVRLLEENLEKPLKRKKPTVWAVWNDLFHENVETEQTEHYGPGNVRERAFRIMQDSPQHTFIILTKRPENMKKYFDAWCNLQRLPRAREDGWLCEGTADWPLPNVWLGVTAENQEAADERIPILCQIPAAVRFVSCEPLLGGIDLRPWLNPECKHCHGDLSVPIPGGGMPCPRCLDERGYQGTDPEHLDWVVGGGESGPRARPWHPAWARRLRDDCTKAGVAFFWKQNGEWYPAVPVPDKGFAGGLRLEHPAGGWTAWNPNGRNYRKMGEDCIAIRVGKKAAGCLLDGREWKEFPEP